MVRLDRTAALLAAVAIVLLVELLGLSAGIKECGLNDMTIVSLGLVLIAYVKFPWLLLIIALIAGSIGLLWPKKPIYRTLIKLLFVITLIAAPVVTYIVVPSAGMPCGAI